MPILQGVLSSQRRVNKRRRARWRPQIGAAGTSFCSESAVKASRPKFRDRDAPILSDASVLKTINCHDRSFIWFAVVVGCGQLPAHGNSIALLDHIEDFYFYRRLSPPAFGGPAPAFGGPLMSHRQNRLARLMQPEVLGEPIADAIWSVRTGSRSNSRSRSFC